MNASELVHSEAERVNKPFIHTTFVVGAGLVGPGVGLLVVIFGVDKSGLL
jgi:hypothetical protein